MNEENKYDFSNWTVAPVSGSPDMGKMSITIETDNPAVADKVNRTPNVVERSALIIARMLGELLPRLGITQRSGNLTIKLEWRPAREDELFDTRPWKEG